MIRGPYRKPKKLTVKDAQWQKRDVVQVNGTRWIIRELNGNYVILHASNTLNYAVVWTTTINLLPPKVSTP